MSLHLSHPAGTALCGLLPHPPVAIPEVGREQSGRCRATTQACRHFAERLVESRPRRVVLVSPHAPRHADAFGLSCGPRLQGDLGEFYASAVEVDLPTDEELAEVVERAADREGVPCWRFSGAALDHGSVVPLSFLVRAGWSGPTLVTSLPWSPGPERLTAFGRALARAAQELAGSTALVASGDMSHRVLPGAPAGYHPRAAAFDERLREFVEAGALEDLARIDPRWREQVAEDVVDSATVVVAALPPRRQGTRVLSYEHPFGVGYLVAVFHEGDGLASER
jgi:aromatic ring-opening dioxygenase LigB subunit